MNLKTVIGVLLLSPIVAYAQPPEAGKGSTLTVYSDNHERFILVLDGKQQNTIAKDDIKLTGLDKPVYDGKIIFEDKSLPILLADIRVTTPGNVTDPSGKRADAYYNIRRTLDGTIELHFLSVVPINEKYLTNDVKYFAHKGGYGGQFIDYTAPIATKTTTHEEVINGKSVMVSSSNTGFDLSGKPIKDKDVKFIDYSASQAKETSTTTTTTNSKGETITLHTKKVTPSDVYGSNTAPVNGNGTQLYVPSGDQLIAIDERKTKPQAIDLSKLGDRQVVKENVHADYMDIQNSSLTEDKLQNLTKYRDDANDQYANAHMVAVSDGSAVVLTNPQTTYTTTTQSTPTVTSSQTTTSQTTTYSAPVVTTTVTTPSQPEVTKYSYSKRGNATTTTIVTDVQPVQTTNNTIPVQAAIPPPPPPPASTPPVQHASDVRAFANAVHAAAVNNAAGQTKVGEDAIPESKHAKAIKKVFTSMSSYHDTETPIAAPQVSNIDTTIDNGQLVVMVPATVTSNGTVQGVNTPAPISATTITSNTVATTSTTTTTPGVVAMDGNSTPYVNSANYEGYNSDGTRRISNAPCPNPMDVPSFDEAKADISALPDDGTKLSTAVMLENSYCFTSQQVFELCMLFTAEHSRLEFAKTSYNKTVDPTNYFKVNNAFQEDASVKELKDFLDKTK
ncbi:MAG: DUF4476 domain-containing protein [Flavipsychrobacter sp.]|nr:DUF4476 domain-containing protein [Flavipsychrobacter sp.]